MWKEKKSKIHGIGITASRDIKKNKKIIQYIGDKITKKEGDKRSAERIAKLGISIILANLIVKWILLKMKFGYLQLRILKKVKS